jgi:hypothetical protein
MFALSTDTFVDVFAEALAQNRHNPPRSTGWWNFPLLPSYLPLVWWCPWVPRS